MVQKINRLLGRIDFRILSLLSVSAMLITIGWSFAHFSDESNTIDSYEDLVQRYLDYRDHNYMLAVPAWYMQHDQLESIENTYGLAGFQNQPDWYVNFNIGTYYFSGKSDFSKYVNHDTKLIIYEDMVSGELLVIRDTGDDFEEDIVFKAPGWLVKGKAESTSNYLYRELSKRRVVWHLTLKEIALAELEEEARLVSLEDEEGGEMMLMMGDPEELIITAIQRTNGMAITVSYPEDFTNRLDLFTCFDLNGEIWQLAAGPVVPTGTTSTTILDTNNWPGPTWRMYTAGNADLDSDSDGYSDAREILMYKTDPGNAASHPVSVYGSISYTGTETGVVYMLAVSSSGSWSMNLSTAIPSPGGFTNDAIALEGQYWFKAFRDVNGNFNWDPWEPYGIYSTTAYNVTGSVSGIDIALSDVPSVWGTLYYYGDATGDVIVIATTSSNDWSTAYSTTIPWEQGSQSETGGTVYLSFPVNYVVVGMPASTYWLKAFIDSNGDGNYNPGEEGGVYSLTPISISNRIAGVNFEISEDTDDDGLPDWWEWLNFGHLDEDAEGDSDDDGLSNLLEYLLGTDPNNPDSDGDGFTDGFEYSMESDPLDNSDMPTLYMLINEGAEYSNNTNLLIRFPGYLADSVEIGEQHDLTNGVMFSFTNPIAFSLNGTSNGVRHLFARLTRNSVTSSLIEGSIIFDNVPPDFVSIAPTNGYSTNRRWIMLTGVATDALSRVRIFVNEQWAHGNTSTSFWHDRILLSSGTNILQLVAQDYAGNTATQMLTVIQDTTGDVSPPSLTVTLPGTSTNDTLAIYGDHPSLYFRGSTDDETAHVIVYSIVDSVTNGPWPAVVSGTQVWCNAALQPGTNSLIIMATDAATNTTAITYTVVRDTNFQFTITYPAHHQVINSPSSMVYGIASPMFLNATITINGVSTIIEDHGSNIMFSTTSKVPLSPDRTELIGQAVLNGNTYYTDPTPVGYEVTRYHAEYVWRNYDYWSDGCFVGEGNTTFHITTSWLPTTKRLVETTDVQTDYCSSSCHSPIVSCDDPHQWEIDYYRPVPNFLVEIGHFYLHLESHSSSYTDILDWDYRATQLDYRFVKRWPTQELQTVILQFPHMNYTRIPYNSPLDPSLITYRGQTGFWYNGNVSFIVPIETEVEYSVVETDFTWPPFNWHAQNAIWKGRHLAFVGNISNETLLISLEWEEFGSDIDDNPNWNGGKRIFPDKQSPTDTLARDKVRLRAKVTPELPNIPLYFKAFDVDDPTPSSMDSNNVIDSNGDAGNDNRGSPSSGTLSATSGVTDNNGEIVLEFTVSKQPGDNFRIAAAFSQMELNQLTVTDPSSPFFVKSDDTKPVQFSGGISEMLTVWRRLWIERDSMSQPSTTHFLGYVDQSSITTLPNRTYFAANYVFYDDDWPQTDEFEGGHVIFRNYDTNAVLIDEIGPFIVTKSESGIFGSSFVLIGELSTGQIASIQSAPVAQFRLWDDDHFSYPITLSGGQVLINALGDAYVFPQYADSFNTRPTITFDRKLSRSAFEFDVDSSRDLTSANDFWAVTVVACHEPTTGFGIFFNTDELDPDIAGPSGGDTPIYPPAGLLPWIVQYGFAEGTLNNNLFVIFCEVVRDDLLDIAPAFTHELGHTGIGGGHPSGAHIMNPDFTWQVDNFRAEDIHTIRGIIKW